MEHIHCLTGERLFVRVCLCVDDVDVWSHCRGQRLNHRHLTLDEFLEEGMRAMWVRYWATNRSNAMTACHLFYRLYKYRQSGTITTQ